MTRATRQGAVAPVDGRGILHDPAPATTRCSVLVALANPLNHVTQSTCHGRGDKRPEDVGTIEVPAFTMPTDGAGDEAEPRASREVERPHLVRRRPRSLERCPARHVWSLTAILGGGEKTQPGQVTGPGCVKD